MQTHFFQLVLLLWLSFGWLGCDAPRSPTSQAQSSTGTVVTLAYNRYIQDSFTAAPSPLDALRAMIDEETLDIEVSLRILPDSNSAHRDALVVWLMAKDPSIDLFGVDGPWIPEFANAGWIEPLGERLPELESDFSSAGLASFSWRGQVYGVPFWSSLGGLYYRKDWLDALGMAPPFSFDAMNAAIDRTMAAHEDVTGFLWAGGRNEDLILLWSEVFHGFGGEFFDENGRCAVDSEAGVASVEWLRDRLRSGHSPRSATTWNAEEARQRFVSGNALFLSHNHDLTTWLDDPSRSQIAGRWGFTTMPSLEGVEPSAITGGFAFALNPFGKRKEAATAVLRLLASERMQRAFADAWGPVQFHRSLLPDVGATATNSIPSSLRSVLPFARPRPQTIDYARTSQTLQRELNAALTDQKSAREALSDARTEIERFQAPTPSP